MKNNDSKIKVVYKENKLLNIFYKLINKKYKVNSSAFLWFENKNIKCWDIPPRIELLLNVTNEKNCELFWIVKNPNKNKRIALEIGKVSFKTEKVINKNLSQTILKSVKENIIIFYYENIMTLYDNHIVNLIKRSLNKINLDFQNYEINYLFTDKEIWNDFKWDVSKDLLSNQVKVEKTEKTTEEDIN